MAAEMILRLWSGRREMFLRDLKFYRDRAAATLLGSFDDAHLEAQRQVDAEFFHLGRYLDPTGQDRSTFQVRPHDRQTDFMQIIMDLRSRFLLAAVRGLVDGWERQLRAWLQDELRHFPALVPVAEVMSSLSLDDVLSVLDSSGWELFSQSFFPEIAGHRCRMAVDIGSVVDIDLADVDVVYGALAKFWGFAPELTCGSTIAMRSRISMKS